MTNNPKPIRIDVGLTGDVRLVDVDTFFAQEKVTKQLEMMSKMDIVGKKLNGKIPFPKKSSENSE